MLQTDRDLGKSSSRTHVAIVEHIKGYFKATSVNGNAVRGKVVLVKLCGTKNHQRASDVS